MTFRQPHLHPHTSMPLPRLPLARPGARAHCREACSSAERVIFLPDAGGSRAGSPRPAPASPRPSGRKVSPPPELGGGGADGGGGGGGGSWDGGSGRRRRRHGLPAGPGDGPVAEMGQGEGSLGAGSARGRCGIPSPVASGSASSPPRGAERVLPEGEGAAARPRRCGRFVAHSKLARKGCSGTKPAVWRARSEPGSGGLV